MEIFFLSFILIGLSLVGMAAGVLLKRGCIKGSCGGLNQILGTSCSACPRSNTCQNKREA